MFEMIQDEHTITVSGNGTDAEAKQSAALLFQAGEAISGQSPLELHLMDLELETGTSVAHFTSAIRKLCRSGRHLILHNTPQDLAHTLYKVGELEGDALHIESVRWDQGRTGG